MRACDDGLVCDGLQRLWVCAHERGDHAGGVCPWTCGWTIDNESSRGDDKLKGVMQLELEIKVSSCDFECSKVALKEETHF